MRAKKKEQSDVKTVILLYDIKLSTGLKKTKRQNSKMKKFILPPFLLVNNGFVFFDSQFYKTNILKKNIYI